MKDQDIRVLAATMEAGFGELNRVMALRFEQQDNVSTQRHEENIDRMTRIESEVARTNDKVATTSARLGVVDSLLSGIRNELDRLWRRVSGSVTEGTLKRDVTLVLATVGLTYGVMKLFGMLK